MSCAVIMVAREMLRNGYQPGLGLGKTLNETVKPVALPKNQFTFGLGYEPSEEEIRVARDRKGRGIFLPKLIPTIDQRFSKLVIAKTSDMSTEFSYDDIINEIQSLFLEDGDDHDVVIEDIAETPTVRIVEPGFELKNWICISAPVRREFQ
ncbi:hypothetical protein KY289_013429 [Solanum tuberosum]|nr:hypothetical protein KY289_013429 [Solanum tuberosum]